MEGSKTLTDMPDLAMHKIMEELEMRSIISLQKVSVGLHDFVTTTKPDFKLTKIEIHMAPDHIKMVLKDQKLLNIEFRDHDDGCLMLCNSKEKLVENENFSDLFLKNLQKIWAHQKSILTELCLDFPELSENLKSILTSKKSQIRAGKISITTGNPSDILDILQYATPGVLKGISLQNQAGSHLKTLWNLDDVVLLEQWKKAETLDTSGFQLDLPICHYAHFSAANLSVTNVSARDLWMLKETLIKNPSAKQFSLNYQFLVDGDSIHRLFGHSQLDGTQIQSNKGSFIRIPNADKSLLYVFYSANFAQLSIMQDLFRA